MDYRTPLIAGAAAYGSSSPPGVATFTPRASSGGFFDAFISVFSGGRLFARVDKGYYVAGETITGQIIADLSAPVNARGIDLSVSGYEKVEWHSAEQVPNHNGQPGFHKRHHRHRGKKIFFANTQRIYNIQGGSMMPGQHVFPFSYTLPPQLPGSFYQRTGMYHVSPEDSFHEDDYCGNGWADSDDEDARDSRRGYQRSALLAMVQYKINVKLDVGGFFHANLHARLPLIVHPRLEVNVQPAMSQMSQGVTVCCCIDKGHCSVEAHFDKTAYTAGETARIHATVDNQSTESLRMAVKLHRTITVRSNGRSGYGNTHVLRQVVAEQRYEPVAPHQKQERDMPLPLTSEQIVPSTMGDFVRCEYQYTVESQVSMGSDIVLRMPVTIYAPQPRPLGM